MTIGSPIRPLPTKPDVYDLKVGQKFVRFYDPARGPWNEHRFYGPMPDMRFDHQIPPCRPTGSRSVWYASSSLIGAVAETFGRLGFVDKNSGKHVVFVEIMAPLNLIDLVGVAARSIGLTQEIAATTDYRTCQEWARAFYEDYLHLQGIRWRGRQTGSLCYVLHDRAAMANLAVASDNSISDLRVWPRIAKAARRCSLRVI